MPGKIDARLAELGITLATPPAPLGSYIPYVITGDLVVISGQIPMHDGKMVATGKLGAGVDMAQGQAAARQCLINLLTHLKAACGGDLDRVQQVVRLAGYVAAPPEFTQHAQVMNGASDLAGDIFGEIGRHARSTIGVPSLPGDAPIEVDGMFRIA